MKRVPEAAKVPVAKREQTKGMTPSETVDYYSKNEMLGKLPSGEPWAADIVDSSTRRQPVTGATLPTNSKIRFFPQSKLNLPTDQRVPHGFFSAEIDRFMDDPTLYPGTAAMMQNLRKQYAKNPLSSRLPQPVHLETLAAPEGVGGRGYQMAYDVIRGSGGLNTADALTPANILRRPLNVANAYYSRGNLQNILPISERGTGYGSESLMSRVFGIPGTHSEQQSDARKYLAGLFGFDDPMDPALTKLLGLTSRKAAERSLENPQGMAGYLELMNAVRAAQLRIPGFGQDVHPADLSALKAIYDPLAKGRLNRSGVEGALGPGALGRARTTEEAILGQRMGMTPEEIAERILQGSKDPSKEFAGRYRKGGLAALA